jgi:hypothetical protein
MKYASARQYVKRLRSSSILSTSGKKHDTNKSMIVDQVVNDTGVNRDILFIWPV